jgi:hypothetical protein
MQRRQLLPIVLTALLCSIVMVGGALARLNAGVVDAVTGAVFFAGMMIAVPMTRVNRTASQIGLLVGPPAGAFTGWLLSRVGLERYELAFWLMVGVLFLLALRRVRRRASNPYP